VKLWLLRHAQVLVDAGTCYGSTNVDCDPEATDTAAKSFAPNPSLGSTLWTSPSIRACKLAQALSSLRPDLQGPSTDNRLQEMDFGQWEMQPWESIPRVAIDEWADEFPHHRFGGKECVQDVLDRVADALSNACLLGVPEMVWVTHAGVIRAVEFLSTDEKQTKISSAADWPTYAPSVGEWMCLEIQK
jgi:alpha-ribazole phosphatase